MTGNNHPAVEVALAKLKLNQNPDLLSLEEVMMCRYQRPCRRISSGVLPRLCRYDRGSVLVYQREVILVLEPNDDTTYFAHYRERFIAPRLHHKGLMPGSSFYTLGGSKFYVEEPDRVKELRSLMKLRSSYFSDNGDCNGDCGSGKGILGSHHRCREAFALLGRLSGEHLRDALLAGGVV